MYDVAVYDLVGRRVRSLASGRATAGRHIVDWDLHSDRGVAMPQGMYIIRIDIDGRDSARPVFVAR